MEKESVSEEELGEEENASNRKGESDKSPGDIARSEHLYLYLLESDSWASYKFCP